MKYRVAGTGNPAQPMVSVIAPEATTKRGSPGHEPVLRGVTGVPGAASSSSSASGAGRPRMRCAQPGSCPAGCGAHGVVVRGEHRWRSRPMSCSPAPTSPGRERTHIPGVPLALAPGDPHHPRPRDDSHFRRARLRHPRAPCTCRRDSVARFVDARRPRSRPAGIRSPPRAPLRAPALRARRWPPPLPPPSRPRGAHEDDCNALSPAAAP